MEQHNIDSRFKQGLENLNRQPSEDAWARLQSQMNAPEVAPEPVATQPEEKETKRILLWWHYAAAAVVLLFISLGILKNGSNFGGKTAPELAVNQAKELPATTENATAIKPEVTLQNSASESEVAFNETKKNKTRKSVENTPKEELNAAFKVASTEQLAQVATKVKKRKAVIVDPEKRPVAEIKVNKPTETMLAANTQKLTPAPETKEVRSSGLAGMAIEVIVKKDNSENALAVNTPAVEEDKDSKLKSIFKQARNLKNGEKVDLQALGVNTDSKLAMGTRSIHQKVSKVLDI